MDPTMNTLKGKYLAAVLAAASALAACTGCSNATPIGPVAPTVAFAASESDVAPACAIVGTPEVVAAHVMPMAGVTAEADGSRVWVRYATKGDPRAAVELDPSTLAVEGEDGTAPREAPASGAQRTAGGPVAVSLEGGRKLVAWTEGSVYAGERVRAVTLTEGGTTVGAPIDLGYEGSAIGRPAVAVTESGRGVLAFEESYGGGFHLVVTRVVCAPAGNR
jgi:hypothetical protein